MPEKEPQTLQSLIALLPSFKERPAVGLRQEIGLRWWSYRRLYREACRAAQAFKDRGLRPGDHVLLWAANCPEWVACFLGAALRGLIIVPVDENSPPSYVQALAQEVGAKLLVRGPKQSAEGLSIPTLHIYFSYDEPEVPLGSEDLAVPLKPDDTALIIYTSGTTANPRGVVLTHGNLMSAAGLFRPWRFLLRRVPFRLLVTSPLSHIQGLSLGVCVALYIGLSVIYTHATHPDHLIRTIRDNRVTLISTVPRVLRLLTQNLLQRPSGRKGLRLEDRLRNIRRWWWRRHVLFNALHDVVGYRFWVLFVGGAPLAEADEKFWRDTGCYLIQGYGMTETVGFTTVNAPFTGRLGSIGKPVSNLDVRIAEDGEILVRGPNVTPGYHRDATATASAFTDGFLHTGDIIRRDSRNRLYFCGRKKEVITTGEGYNVYPEEIEDVLNQLPGVVESVVIGMEREGQEEIHAVLLLGDRMQAAQIIRQANAGLHPHQMIRSWTTWTDGNLPRTRSLKTKRERVAAAVRHARAKEEPGARSGAEGAPSLEKIQAMNERGQRLRMIARYLAETPPNCQPPDHLRLEEDLGLSSLDLVELLLLLEKEGHFSVGGAVVPEHATIFDLRTIVTAHGEKRAAQRANRRPPRWAETTFMNLIHRMVRPLLIPTWLGLRATLAVRGEEHLHEVNEPFILAGFHHRHAMDVFAVYCALPRRLRRRLMTVSGRWVYRDFLNPGAEVSFWRRLYIAWAFYVGAPSLFPFALVAQREAAREGLMEGCRFIDRRFSPIIFPERFPAVPTGDNPVQPGVWLIARQTQAPILPVLFEGNEALGFRPSLRRAAFQVKFGRPVRVTPQTTLEDAMAMLKDSVAAIS